MTGWSKIGILLIYLYQMYHREMTGMSGGSGGVGYGELRNEEVYEELLKRRVKEGASLGAGELGKRICIHLRGFERFAATPWKEFATIRGVNVDTATYLGVLADICRRAQDEREVTRLIDSPAAAARYAAAKLRDYDNEATLLMCLSGDFHCELCRVVAEGSAFSTRADSYSIVSAVLNAGTRMAILAHNHPTEVPEPSDSDVMVTYNLLHSLKNAGIILLDHIIVSGDTYTSMAAHGDFKGETEPERRIYCPAADDAAGEV